MHNEQKIRKIVKRWCFESTLFSDLSMGLTATMSRQIWKDHAKIVGCSFLNNRMFRKANWLRGSLWGFWGGWPFWGKKKCKSVNNLRCLKVIIWVFLVSASHLVVCKQAKKCWKPPYFTHVASWYSRKAPIWKWVDGISSEETLKNHKYINAKRLRNALPHTKHLWWSC